MSHTSRDASGLGTPSLASRAVTGELEGLLPGVAPVLSASDAGDSDDRHEEAADGLDVPFGVLHLFQGAIGDWRRRWRHQFTSDYLDGFRWQTLSAGLFTFFGVLSSTVCLGHRIQRASGGQIGFIEYILVNFCAGLVYARDSSRGLRA